MLLQKLEQQNLIQPPSWLAMNTMFLCQMGSVAYGVSGQSSDIDVYGFCVPPKDLVFPHLAGVIDGFGRQKQRFDVWTQHHIKTLDGHKEYDFSVYSIVRFFHLAMENNPNMVDSLFVPRRCVLHSTQMYERIRERRRIFLHRGAMHKLRGYAFSQFHKIVKGGRNRSNPKRATDIEAHGFDTKAGYHVVRLCLQAEQILVEHDLDLERNSEILKSIRRGEWSLEKLEDWFTEKEKSLEGVYASSKLRHSPDEDAIKALLLESLEQHYGSLQGAIQKDPSVDMLVRDLKEVLSRYETRSIGE